MIILIAICLFYTKCREIHEEQWIYKQFRTILRSIIHDYIMLLYFSHTPITNYWHTKLKVNKHKHNLAKFQRILLEFDGSIRVNRTFYSAFFSKITKYNRRHRDVVWSDLCVLLFIIIVCRCHPHTTTHLLCAI